MPVQSCGVAAHSIASNQAPWTNSFIYAQEINGGREPGRFWSCVGHWWHFMDMVLNSWLWSPMCPACLDQVYVGDPTTNSKPCPWNVIDVQHVTNMYIYQALSLCWSFVHKCMNLCEEGESLVRGYSCTVNAGILILTCRKFGNSV